MPQPAPRRPRDSTIPQGSWSATRLMTPHNCHRSRGPDCRFPGRRTWARFGRLPLKQANQAILSSTAHGPMSPCNKCGCSRGGSAAIATSMSRRDVITVQIIAGPTTSSFIVREGRSAVVTSASATAVGTDYSAVVPETWHQLVSHLKSSHRTETNTFVDVPTVRRLQDRPVPH